MGDGGSRAPTYSSVWVWLCLAEDPSHHPIWSQVHSVAVLVQSTRSGLNTVAHGTTMDHVFWFADHSQSDNGVSFVTKTIQKWNDSQGFRFSILHTILSDFIFVVFVAFRCSFIECCNDLLENWFKKISDQPSNYLLIYHLSKAIGSLNLAFLSMKFIFPWSPIE